MTNKCYSVNEEEFDITDFSDVIYQLLNQLGVDCASSLIGATYWEADAHPLEYEDVISVDWFLEDCDQRAYEEIGEVFDNDFSGCTEQAKKELEELLLSWCEKHVNLPYWKVENVVKKVIIKEDLE